MAAFTISDLRERPHHADAVAERIWTAFWKHKGTPLSRLRYGVENILKSDKGTPFALVAEVDGKVCGNCLVIENDEEVRKQGIATALLEEGVRRCGALGIERLYLASRPALCGFYTKLGWRMFEENGGKHCQALYVREPGAVPSPP